MKAKVTVTEVVKDNEGEVIGSLGGAIATEETIFDAARFKIQYTHPRGGVGSLIFVDGEHYKVLDVRFSLLSDGIMTEVVVEKTSS